MDIGQDIENFFGQQVGAFAADQIKKNLFDKWVQQGYMPASAENEVVQATLVEFGAILKMYLAGQAKAAASNSSEKTPT